ncbi:hypothetical protein IQ264_01170 [Phormidium sp. LEGE 05292]|uniref:hypothetical protein n=1 Tax=[Phormidium] sp. LEGE 05292 TaxID=767427 RepID=UPI001880836E|nr:hypothetical protein [Phormidium sp. LEGE 05292]MBE9224083.1 hypothetical protein [Phormidium sp. LEGE 05292]
MALTLIQPISRKDSGGEEMRLPQWRESFGSNGNCLALRQPSLRETVTTVVCFLRACTILNKT